MSPFQQVFSIGGPNPIGVTTMPPVAPAADPGQVVFTSTQNWTVPSGVTAISMVCVGGGGGGSYCDGNGEQSGAGGGGGALAWVNNVSVSAGQVMEVVVGGAGEGGVSGDEWTKNGNDGGDSYVRNESASNTTLCDAEGGEGADHSEWQWTVAEGGAGGNVLTGSGGEGGTGGDSYDGLFGGGGGGAGGYEGKGGNGGTGWGNGTDGSGGGGGGGGTTGHWGAPEGSGGGVGLIQEGTSGEGKTRDVPGEGGSGGEDGVAWSGQRGGNYGGGGAGRDDDSSGSGTDGGQGGVRIIWGEGRSYPNNSSDV